YSCCAVPASTRSCARAGRCSGVRSTRRRSTRRRTRWTSPCIAGRMRWPHRSTTRSRAPDSVQRPSPCSARLLLLSGRAWAGGSDGVSRGVRRPPAPRAMREPEGARCATVVYVQARCSLDSRRSCKYIMESGQNKMHRMESDQNKNAERNGAPGWEECGAADSACEHDAPESTDAAPTPGVDANLTDARAAAEAVRKLASRLQLLTREREELLAAERAARNEAERAIRQTDEFLATLAHELRTPLANVLNWAHVLLEKFADVDELLKKGLSVIADNTTAQSRLISDLLDVSRIGSGKVVLELKPVDFPELIAAAVTAQRPTAEAHRVSLSVELEGEFAV